MADRLQVEEEEVEERTPDQWRIMIVDEKSELEEKSKNQMQSQ